MESKSEVNNITVDKENENNSSPNCKEATISDEVVKSNSESEEETVDDEEVLKDGLFDLQEAVIGLEDHFVCTTDLSPRNCSIKYLDKEQKEHEIHFPLRTHHVLPPGDVETKFDVEMNEEFRSLLDASEQSPFGHNNDTVYDENIRKAKYIPVSRIVQVNIDNVQLNVMKRYIQDVLFPLETGIELKVSLFIYLITVILLLLNTVVIVTCSC